MGRRKKADSYTPAQIVDILRAVEVAKGEDKSTQIIRDEHKLRLMFGGEASPVMARALIERMMDEARDKQEAMLLLEHEPRNTFEQLLYDYALDANAHKLEWLAQALETVSEQFGV